MRSFTCANTLEARIKSNLSKFLFAILLFRNSLNVGIPNDSVIFESFFAGSTPYKFLNFFFLKGIRAIPSLLPISKI